MEPRWDGYLADPFILKGPEGYYAYGTGEPDQESSDCRFPVLFSKDLLAWKSLGSALEVPSALAGQHFWAPEVCEKGGTYFMYFSAGGAEGECHCLRVAAATRPQGPFQHPSPPILPTEPFSIDASPFQDPRTGDYWLFFAKDFFDGEYPGTGCAVVKLAPDLESLAGDAVPILRPDAEWQLYERNRFWYGRIWKAWFTVEGPYCVYRKDRYWLFYSGGLWKGRDYGIGIAVADEITGPYLAAEGPTILKSRPGRRGPGHCSIVVGLDGIDQIVFHAWDEAYTKRQMYVEPLQWSEDGPRLKT